MTASDDAKFERARRERPHIEAFAQITHPKVEPDVESRESAPPRTWPEILADWSRTDEARDNPR